VGRPSSPTPTSLVNQPVAVRGETGNDLISEGRGADSIEGGIGNHEIRGKRKGPGLMIVMEG